MMMARRLRREEEEKETGICWIGQSNFRKMIHHLLAQARGERGIINSAASSAAATRGQCFVEREGGLRYIPPERLLTPVFAGYGRA